jgi:hypothetical protein
MNIENFLDELHESRRIKNIEDIYKGDGINTCKWCGNTGWMHTYSNDGYFYFDAACFCKFGDEIIRQGLWGQKSLGG